MAKKKDSLALPAKPTELIPAGDAPYSDEKAFEVMSRAQDGDETVVQDLRRLLERPHIADGLQVVIRSSLETAIEADTGRNLLGREAALKLVRDRGNELAGPQASPLERMLAEHVVTTWWFLRQAETAFTQGMQREGGISLALGDYLQRRITASQKRYLAAVKMLADVRRMQLPEVTIQNQGQVNIGNQQMNVAADKRHIPTVESSEAVPFA